MCDIEELEEIKNQAFLEGVIGTLARMKFLIDREKDPKVAIEKLLKEVDNAGKGAVEYLSSVCINKFAMLVGTVNP